MVFKNQLTKYMAVKYTAALNEVSTPSNPGSLKFGKKWPKISEVNTPQGILPTKVATITNGNLSHDEDK